MAKITSSLGSQNYSSPGLKKFVVDDSSEFDGEDESNQDQSSASFHNMSASDLEKFAREARNKKSEEQKNINSTVKKRIEVLAGLGRATKDVDVEGVVFSLRTLKSSELHEAVKIIAQFDNGLDSSFEARTQILARSIYKIDGQDLNIILGSDKFEHKLEMVKELESSVSSFLHDHYILLTKENSDKFKIFSNDEKEVKEAVQDLSKSG